MCVLYRARGLPSPGKKIGCQGRVVGGHLGVLSLGCFSCPSVLLLMRLFQWFSHSLLFSGCVSPQGISGAKFEGSHVVGLSGAAADAFVLHFPAGCFTCLVAVLLSPFARFAAVGLLLLLCSVVVGPCFGGLSAAAAGELV